MYWWKNVSSFFFWLYVSSERCYWLELVSIYSAELGISHFYICFYNVESLENSETSDFNGRLIVSFISLSLSLSLYGSFVPFLFICLQLQEKVRVFLVGFLMLYPWSYNFVLSLSLVLYKTPLIWIHMNIFGYRVTPFSPF